MKKRTSVNLTSYISSKTFLVLVIVISAFLAAFLGQVLINSLSITPSLVSMPTQVVRQGSQDINQLRHEVLNTVIEREESALFTLYMNSSEVLTPVAKGVVLTNDGWTVVVPTQAGYIFKGDELGRLASGDLQPIESFKKDTVTDLVFVQFAGQDFKPVTLSNNVSVSVLDELYVINSDNDSSVANVVKYGIKDGASYLLTSKLNTFHYIDSGQPGDSVYNQVSEMVGIVLDSSETRSAVVSADIIRSRLNALLKDQLETSQSVEFYYIDLAQTAVSSAISKDNTSGALITAPGETLSVPPSSLLYEQGLRDGDIIVSIDGNILTQELSLSEFLLFTDLAESVPVGIIRGEDSLSLDLNLL